MIFWCTKLSRANKQDAKEIEAQMRGNAELAHILKQLNETDSDGPGRKRRKKERENFWSNFSLHMDGQLNPFVLTNINIYDIKRNSL